MVIPFNISIECRLLSRFLVFIVCGVVLGNPFYLTLYLNTSLQVDELQINIEEEQRNLVEEMRTSIDENGTGVEYGTEGPEAMALD